jgi:hypothetical protein
VGACHFSVRCDAGELLPCLRLGVAESGDDRGAIGFVDDDDARATMSSGTLPSFAQFLRRAAAKAEDGITGRPKRRQECGGVPNRDECRPALMISAAAPLAFQAGAARAQVVPSVPHVLHATAPDRISPDGSFGRGGARERILVELAKYALGVTAKEKVLERAPHWTEEQAERALRAAEGDDAVDEWGDLSKLHEVTTAETMRRLAEEEHAGGHGPW